MPDQQKRIEFTEGRGGRNGVDWPLKVPPSQVCEAFNVDYSNSTMGRKRNGSVNVAMTGSSFPGAVPMYITALYRHVPGTDEALAELWSVGGTGVLERLAGGTTWTTPTMVDSATLGGSAEPGFFFSFASLNGKLFIAYSSGVARLHVWDPAASGGAKVRRVGLPAPAIPTVADQGAGAYAAVLRYYRTRVVTQIGGVTKYRSEPSASVAFTPSGANGAARVTRGTVPGENETHWELEASTDNVNFFLIATLSIGGGITFYDDSAATTSYLLSPSSPALNTYALPPSARFIAADQNRLLMFGDFTATNPQNRVAFTPVLGSSDVSDDERLPLANYVTLDEKDSGTPTGLAGPMNGAFLAFKYRQVWKLTATGNAADPYSKYPISKVVGAVSNQSVAIGEDESGEAAGYWMSHRGPYRYAMGRLEYIGHNLEDRISQFGAVSQLSLEVAILTFPTVAWSLWYGDRRQLWFCFSTKTNFTFSTLAIYNVGRIATATHAAIPSGWSIFKRGSSDTTNYDFIGYAGCTFSNTLGAAMSRDLKPYIADVINQAVPSTGSTVFIYKADTGTTDAGNTPYGGAYRAYITTRAENPYWPSNQVTAQSTTIIAPAVAATSVQVSVINGSGVETRSESVSLAAVGSETRIVRRVGGDAQTAAAPWIQVTVGDAAAVDNTWSIDGVIVSTLPGEPIAS